jgi:hypothetical protein
MIERGVKSENELKEDTYENLMESIDVWTSFYRANPHRFAKDYFGLNLRKFQQIILCSMFQYNNVMHLASRGGSKSYLIAIYCAISCVLYPETKVCLASKTRGQAGEIIDKIKTILMPSSANLRMEIADIQVNQANSFVTFKNGSQIIVVTAGESSRHYRATTLVVDEFRLVDKNVIDTILRKFLTAPRHPKFLDKQEYKEYPMESTKELYASSCWYESHWSYEHVRSYAVNMVMGRSYFCCAMPYQLAIMENLLDRMKIEDEMSETTFNSVSFQMEMETLFFRQGSGGLYNFEELDNARRVKYPALPNSGNYKISDKKLHIPIKQPGEIRILSADIALMASSARGENDATAIILNRMLPTANKKYTNNICYLENNEGYKTNAQALNIRKLFDEMDGDYLAIDVVGLGRGVVDAIMEELYDPNTGRTYDALGCCNEADPTMTRCLVEGAKKAIWAIKGSQEFNSSCALILREAFKQNQIRLLTSEFDGEEALEEIQGYNKLSLSDKVNFIAPYTNTSLLINELINLQYEVKNGAIKVKEKKGTRKDRYSSLSYNIWLSKKLEYDLGIVNSNKDFSELIMEFKQPRTKKDYLKRR